MNYSKYASDRFTDILNASPANCTDIKEGASNTVIDMGKNAQGGWTSVKLMLDALIGGRGIINVSRDLRGIHQFPAVEAFYDDPVGAYEEAFKGASEVYGIKGDDGYAFGVASCPCVASETKGNVALIGKTSLAAAAFDTTFALADAVKLLLDNGVAAENIMWAWSFSPIADLANDTDAFEANKAKARERRVVSIWLREEDEKLADIVGKYETGTLRLHNLVTARTIMVEGPAVRINC